MKIEKIAKRVFKVYDEAEATEAGIKYRKDWRNAEEGDWILTSDGKVIKVLNRTVWGRKDVKKVTYKLLTGYGRVPTTHSRIFARKYRVRKTEDPWVRDILSTTKQRSAVKKLIDHGKLVKIGDAYVFTDSDKIAAWCATYMENNPSTALRRMNGLLRKNWVKEYVSKIAKEAAKDLGWDEGRYVKELVKMFNSEAAKGDGVKTRRLLLNDLGNVTGALDKEKEERSETSVIMFSPDAQKYIDAISMLRALIDGGRITIDAEYREVIDKLVTEALTQGAKVPQLKGEVK